MAAFASSASVQFNTYLYFKNLQDKEGKEVFEEAMIMRVTKAGLYVMIKAYGIEGMLSEDERSQIHIDGEKDEAIINGEIVLHAFDTIKIQILAVCVEFRR